MISSFLVFFFFYIFTDIIFKFIASGAVSKFWKHHILFFIISIKFVSHQIHIWRFFMPLLLDLIPVASHGRLLHNHLMIACLRFSLRCLFLHSLIKQRKCQITIIKTVLPARNYNYSAKQWYPKPRWGHSFRFWIGMLSTTRRLETLQGWKKGGRNYAFCPSLK